MSQGLSWDRFGLGPLPRLANLVSLKFEDRIVLDRRAARALAPGLGLLTNLRSLILPSKCLSDLKPKEISAFSAALSGLVAMEYLVLKDVSLGPKSLKGILCGLHTLPKDISHLSSDSSSPNSSGADEAATAAPAPAWLTALTALTHLDLSQNYGLFRGDDGEYEGADSSMISIAACLCLLTGLVHLDLGSTYCSDGLGPAGEAVSASAVAALGIGLPASLTFLSLARNSFGSECITALAGPSGLQRLTALRVLSLGGSLKRDDSAAAGAACMHALARCFQHMPYLENLDLGFNGIAGAGAHALAGCLQHMPKLRSLDLCYNSLCDGDVAALSGSLLGLSSLTMVIGIQDNRLTQGGIASFKAAFHDAGRSEVKCPSRDDKDWGLIDGWPWPRNDG